MTVTRELLRNQYLDAIKSARGTGPDEEARVAAVAAVARMRAEEALDGNAAESEPEGLGDAVEGRGGPSSDRA